jgi:hypothetical protein
MLYQSDEETFGYDGDDTTESENDEALRAQQDAEEFPLGRHGPDSTILERLGEAEEGTTERNVARDLILREINKSVLPDLVRESASLAGKHEKGQSSCGKRGKRKRTENEDKKDSAPRTVKKVQRYDNITGEPTKEFLAKHHNVWKVQKIQRNKRNKGREILRDAAALDQYIMESFVYTEHVFELDYNDTSENPRTPNSFQHDLVLRWMEAHPDKPLEYLDEENKIRQYHAEDTEWSTLPWNKPTEWFLDISKLIEDDRLCIIQMLYEVTIDPYKQLIESIPFTRLETRGE